MPVEKQETLTIQQAIDLAIQHHTAGDLSKAESLFQQVLQADPNHPVVLHLLGVIAFQGGKNDLAVDFINKALAIKPNYAEAHSNLGLAFGNLGRFEEAEACFHKALAIKPNYAEVHSSLGNLLKDQGALVEAAVSYHKALALNPNLGESHYNLGNTLKGLGKLDEAVASFHKALAINPDFAEAHSNLGNALRDLGDLNGAVASYHKALAIKPDDAGGHNNMGIVLKGLGKLDEAMTSYHKALAINPNYAEAHTNLGNVLKDLGQMIEAIACYDKAIALQPELAMTSYNKSIALLTLGQFDKGWPLYEWRWKVEAMDNNKRGFEQPLWLGVEPLNEKTILLHSEQGVGDTLQFCRYAKLVKALGARVIMEVPKSVLSLLQNLEGVDVLIEKGSPLPHFDYYCPLMSLPLAFNTNINTIPSNATYLQCDNSKVSKWETKLEAMTNLRVGLVWGGSTLNKRDSMRSMDPMFFKPLLELTNISFFSLQFGLDGEARRVFDNQIVDLMPDAAPFIETAAVMENLDLIITVDTAPAHLAGALGVPVWTLLDYNPDWRWMLERKDSPWYPSMRLFRQDEPGDWKGMIDKVSSELSNKIQDKQAAS